MLLFPGESAAPIVDRIAELGGKIVARSDGWLKIALHRARLTELAHEQGIWRVYESLPTRLMGEEVGADRAQQALARDDRDDIVSVDAGILGHLRQ